MQKIQCLQMARNFLGNNLMNSMQSLANGHHWRSRFDDQLQISYKDWLLKKVTEEFVKSSKVDEFLGGPVLSEQL